MLTTRPHFWRIMSWTRARDSAIGALLWTATKSFHSSGVTSQNLIGCCRLSLRIVAWPTPALLTRMSITPKRTRALATTSSIASSRARSASIVSKLAPCWRCCAICVSSARPWVVRSTAATLSPLPSRPSTNSRPMPPAAPVTIAVRCCPLIVSSYRFRLLQQTAAVDWDDRAVDKGHRRREPEDHRRHFLGLPDPLERVAGDPLGALLRRPHVCHRRFHQAGRHGDDPDRRRQGSRQRHRHRVQPGLGRGIGDVAAAAAHPRDRADIDDEPLPARLEQRPAGAHRRERPTQIDRQHKVEELVVESPQIGVWDYPGAAGIVDQDVEPALGGTDRGGEVFDCARILRRGLAGAVAGAAEARDQLLCR